jgi:integrase
MAGFHFCNGLDEIRFTTRTARCSRPPGTGAAGHFGTRVSSRAGRHMPRVQGSPVPSTGISCTLHQLRHSHATEMVNGGVSLATIRKRLGHQYLQTTLRNAEISDSTADAEVRSWRRRVPR